MKIPMPAVRKRPRIEIIPLIDIIFFLLATFVMVSLSMVKNQGIRVNLPTAATSTAQEQKHTPVTVTVTTDGTFYLNKEELSLVQITARLTQLKADDPELIVIINGDRKAFFGDAIGILDEIRRLGISKVTIQTQGKGSSGDSKQ